MMSALGVMGMVPMCSMKGMPPESGVCLLDHPRYYECAGQFYVNMHRRYEKKEYRPRGVAPILLTRSRTSSHFFFFTPFSALTRCSSSCLCAIVRFNISASYCSSATSLDTESVGEMCAKVFSRLIQEDRPHALHVARPTFVVP